MGAYEEGHCPSQGVCRWEGGGGVDGEKRNKTNIGTMGNQTTQ